MFNPQTNVANPDLIAYEALVGDRQQLTFHRLSDNKTFAALSAPLSPGALQAPGLAAGRGVTVFSGDMDWHPVRAEGSTGKQWFTYVATDRGVGKLFVNYLDAYGNLAKESPIQLPFAGGVRQPRWSPDGKHLAVVSDSSVLQVFWNVDQVLAMQRSVAALRPTVAVESGTGVTQPSWSPRSNYIAYQAERVIRGVRRSQVEVIGVDAEARRFRGAPVVVSTDLDDVGVYRPSWSQDAKYLALYTDRDGRGAAGALDIAVVELQMESGTGRVIRGALRRGQANRIATSVSANVARGPSWSRATSGGIPQLALVYAQADTGRAVPIYLHLLDSWLNSRGRDAERVEISAGFTSVAHREVTATESNGFVRYTYATDVSGAGMVNTYDDRLARWATGAAPVVPLTVVAPRIVFEPRVLRPSSLPLAFVFPGAGQLRGDHKVKGAVLAGVGIIGVALFVKGTSGTFSAADESVIAFDNKNLIANKAALERFDSERSTQMIGAGAFGVAWVAGLIDAGIQRKSATRVSAIGTRSKASASGLSNVHVGLGVSFGNTHR